MCYSRRAIRIEKCLVAVGVILSEVETSTGGGVMYSFWIIAGQMVDPRKVSAAFKITTQTLVEEVKRFQKTDICMTILYQLPWKKKINEYLNANGF